MDGRATGKGSDFRQMVLWQKAQSLAEDAIEAIAAMPRDRVSDVIARQMLRAVTSVAANIAEGYGRYSRASYRNHLSIARGSAFEVESWLDLLQRRGYIADERADSLLSGCTEVQKLLTLRMKSLEQGTVRAVREEEYEYEV
jgi:four helix bundle protein